MPIDQYRKDKRIVRGIQKGATSFSNSTAMAVIDLTQRLVHVIQNTAQFAHDVVSPPTAHRPALTYISSSGTHHGVSQPRDFREGVSVAYSGLKQGVHETIYEYKSAGSRADGFQGTFGVVVRQIPSTVIMPVIQISAAVENVLTGVRNQLAPEARLEDEKKFKIEGNSPQR